MELQEAIRNRRTVREFDPRPVSDAVVERALAAGLMAPTHNHLRQWHFLLVEDPAVRMRVALAEDLQESISDSSLDYFDGLDSMARDMYLYACPLQRRMVLTAPRLLIPVYKPNTPFEELKRMYELNCFASIWACIENILLSLAEDDVYGVTCIPQNTPAIKSVLGIPAEMEIPALIPFGYKAANAKIVPQKHIELAGRMHRDHW